MTIRRPNMVPNKTSMAVQPIEARTKNELEVELGYTKEEAMSEAERCLDCPEKYCLEHCPVHTAIPDFIREIREGNFEKAYDIIEESNPLADIASRVCPCSLQCESHCTRGIKSEPVAIGRLERFVRDVNTDRLSNRKLHITPKDLMVAVVGAGPAGLTCALNLAKESVKVTVFEKSDRLGGAMGWGIPSFVLPKSLPERLIARLEDYGVVFVTGVQLGRDKSLSELQEQYDAVFIATGAGIPVNAGHGQIDGLMQAADYLAAEQKPKLNKVMVFGGGSTAIDAARAALRTGAGQVRLVYRRTETEMPATKDEIELAKEEGVEFFPLTAPVEFIANDGKLTAVKCEKMELAAPDYPGGRKNSAPTGNYTVYDTDLAVLALGFNNEPVSGLKMDSRNRIIVDKSGLTSERLIYAGGDAVNGPSTLMKASAAGWDAAKAILSRLAN